MFMTVAFPWPVPSANADLAGFRTAGPQAAEAATHVPDTGADAHTFRPEQVEELICWTRRERMRLVWYRLRLTARELCRPSRGAREARLNARRG